MDLIRIARLHNAAYCERNGIPCEHEFTAEELAEAHAQLEDAEDILGPRDDMPTLREERELRGAKLDDPRRGCVPPYFKR